MTGLAPGALALLCAGLAAVAIAACGGDTAEDNEYVEQVNEVSQTFEQGLAEIASGGSSAPEQLANGLRRIADQISQSADELAEISPPDDVADLHDRLVEEVEGLRDVAINAADEISAGGPAAATGAAAQLIAEANRIGAEIQSTINEINSTLQG